jgi:FKBP-type peptidyl-prolyl cis-trans isomerase
MLVRGPRPAAARAGGNARKRHAGVIQQTPNPIARARRSDDDGAARSPDGHQQQQQRRRAAAAAADAALGRRGACLSLALLAAAIPSAASPAQARAAPGDDDARGPVSTKTPSGARLQVIEPGTRGEPIAAPPLGADGAVAPGDRVEIDYTLRRFNGYFIYGNVEGVSFQPRDVPTGVVEIAMGGACGGVGGADGAGGAPAVIRGLEEALVGLREGARFRVLVPPELGYTDGGAGGLGPLPPTFATKRQLLNHAREPLLFEVEVLKVKKQRQQQQRR